MQKKNQVFITINDWLNYKELKATRITTHYRFFLFGVLTWNSHTYRFYRHRDFFGFWTKWMKNEMKFRWIFIIGRRLFSSYLYKCYNGPSGKIGGRNRMFPVERSWNTRTKWLMKICLVVTTTSCHHGQCETERTRVLRRRYGVLSVDRHRRSSFIVISTIV